MSGRLDNEIKVEKTINKKLKNMPEYVNSWYIYLTASNKTVTSRNDFINKLNNFLLSINENISLIKPEDITFESVENYFIKIKTVNKNGKISYSSDSYKQGIWSCLNNFFEYMVKIKHLYPENYMSMIDRPKNKDLDRINQNRILLTENDFNRILKSVGDCKSFDNNILKNRDMAILLLFMSTGMRREALSEIDINDLRDNVLTIIDKQNKRHEYILNEITHKYIKRWLSDRDKIINKVLNNTNTNALFITRYGNRMSGTSIYNLVSKYCNDALGYKISPHKLRSGFCSIMYKKTGDIEFVRRAVGHSNTVTTQRYIVTNGFEKQKASNIMNDLLKV